MLLVNENSFNDTVFPQLFVENLKRSDEYKRWEVTISAYMDSALFSNINSYGLDDLKVCVIRLQDVGEEISPNAFQAYTTNLFSNTRDPLLLAKKGRISEETLQAKEESLNTFTSVPSAEVATINVDLPGGTIKTRRTFTFDFDVAVPGNVEGANIHFIFFPMIKSSNNPIFSQPKPENINYGPLKIIQATDENKEPVKKINYLTDSEGKIWAGGYHIMNNSKYMKGLIHDNTSEELNLVSTYAPYINQTDIQIAAISNSIFYLPSISYYFLDQLVNQTEAPLKIGNSSPTIPELASLTPPDKSSFSKSSMSSGLFNLSPSFPINSQSNLIKSSSPILKTPEARQPDTLLRMQPKQFQFESVRIEKSAFINSSNTSTKVRKKQPIKNGTTIYSSVTTDNKVCSIFAVDKVNLIKNFSKLSKVIDNIPDSEFEEVLSKTKIKNVSIDRVTKDGRNKITESVFDRNVSEIENSDANIVEHYSNPIFKTGEQKLVSAFKVESKLSSDKRTKFYSFIDYRTNTSLQDEYNYVAEIEFRDGLEEYLTNKAKTFLRNFRHLKSIYQLLHTKQAFSTSSESYKDGEYNSNIINRIPREDFLRILRIPRDNVSKSNINYLEDKLRIIVGSYVDIVNLFIPKQARNTKEAMRVLLEQISVLSGKRQKLEHFISGLDKFKEKLLITIERKADKLEKSITKSKRTGKDRNKRKNLKFTLTSDKVRLIKDRVNPVDYISDNVTINDTFPSILSSNFATNFNITNKFISPKYLYADGVKTTLNTSAPIDNIVAMNNQVMGLINLNVRQGYIDNNEESQDSIEELILKDRALQSLADIGVYVKERITIKPVKNVINNLSKQSTAVKTNVSTALLTKSSALISSVSSLNRSIPVEKKELDINVKPIEKQKNLDFDYEIADLAVEFMLGDLIDKRKSKEIKVKDLSEYAMNNCFNSRIQYLSGFQIVDNINTFKEMWVSLDRAQDLDISTKNLLCRLQPIEQNSLGLKLRTKFNVINLNNYFIISSKSVRNLQQTTKTPINVYFSSELTTMSEEVREMVGLDDFFADVADLIELYANQLSFNIGIPINQTINVKVFGTNFAPTPENIVYGTKNSSNTRQIQNTGNVRTPATNSSLMSRTLAGRQTIPNTTPRGSGY